MNRDPTISYLHTTPAPPLEGTDAVHNEVNRLAAHFNGTITNLYPFKRPTSLLPRSLYGWHQWTQLKQLDRQKVIHHVFSPTLAYYPVLRRLRSPIVYSVSANVGSRKHSHFKEMSKWGRIIVSNSRDFEQLQIWGLNNVDVVVPGIDLSSFPRLMEPPTGKFTLLAASAPWEKRQFETKGINLLLQAIKVIPDIKLILLWRGLYVKDIRQKVSDLKIGTQVEIIDRKVNVSEIMQRVHVTVLLVKEPGIVKAYPHSLVESLASGRPVLLSNLIPMADYVLKYECGKVIDHFTVEELLGGINEIIHHYDEMANRIPGDVSDQFSTKRMMDHLSKIYRSQV